MALSKLAVKGAKGLLAQGMGCLRSGMRWLGEHRGAMAALLLLFLLPLSLFWEVTIGGKTLLPADNFFAWPPWRAFAQEAGVNVPHNELLSDLILENYPWKRFIVECIRSRRLPLWNPYILAGVPFLAAGQHSALYPLSLVFYLLPLPRAYGWFTVIQLFLAGLSMYILARVLGMGRFGAILSAITYMLSAFFVVSVVFPMIIAAASWLPLLLALAELVLRKGGGREALPYVLLGTLTLGVQFLAGHVEISYYVLLVLAFFSLWRLVALWVERHSRAQVARAAFWLATMVALGMGLGAVQLIPLYELVRVNFRQDSVTYAQVINWAYPWRQVLTFIIPDFFGNPSHHRYFDLLSWRWIPVTSDFQGRPITTIFWGIKNYVEAGSYVGILPLLLALVALWRWRRGHVRFFALLALVSLLFAFGTPLYALLYYGLPGFKQLHSPFRWVFPYTLAIAVLAGMGAEALVSAFREGKGIGRLWMPFFWTGVTLLAGLAIALLFPAPFVGLAERFLARSQMAQQAFADGRAFFSYQWRNLFLFALFLTASGAVLRISRCPIYLPRWLGGGQVWKPLALAVVILDLFIAGYGFNPAADPRWLEFVPPAVRFLQRDKELFRIFSFRNDKILNANSAWLFHLHDVRGYDSIIPKQYADFISLVEDQQGMLLFNRIGDFWNADSLRSPILDLLNVKYVLSETPLEVPGYTLVYQGEVLIYRNDDYLPRAFLVPEAKVLPREELARELRTFDPRRWVLLEESPAHPPASGSPASEPLPTPTIVSYSPNEVLISATLPHTGWLVLADSFFPGWKAYDRSPPQEEERELAIYRADGNFRAVLLGPGEHLVRFKYSPMSFKLGLYVSFMSGVVALLLGGYWLWASFWREDESVARRVAKNSLIPMGLSLLNKLLDFVFAMLMLRILGPELAGRFQFAVVFIGYFEILVLFGLGTLLTREVAKDRSQANRYLSTAVVLRFFLWLLSLPLMGLVLFLYMRIGALTMDTVAAVGLFALALLFSNVSEAMSAVFYAYEKMEYPAALTTASTLLKMALGTLVLLTGWGFVGLAGVSVVVNVFTLSILYNGIWHHFFRPHLEFDPRFGRELLSLSWPLMLNHLLATVFFRVDILLLQAMKGAEVVGFYGAAYKYIDGLGVIPAYFTLAIFPLMSRYAASARDSLMRTYVGSLRLLLLVSIPVAVGTPFVARQLILLLGGGQYLPHSMIALQLLIGFFPLSCINSVTQYVLIAINQQRFLTKAFLIGVGFNVVANLLLIPRYSYQAAAVVTILSELALLLPFYYSVRKHLGALPWPYLFWRPLAASAAMGAFLWWFRDGNALLLIPLAGCIYLIALLALRTITAEDMALLQELIPRQRPRPQAEVTPE